MRAWHEAARLGDRRAADAPAPIAQTEDCDYARLALDHARALAAGDPAGLSAAAERLDDTGYSGAAADAARQAAEAG